MSEPIRLPGVEVEPPPVTPYRYGLFSAASVQPDADRRWEIAGVNYQSEGCERGGGIWLEPCWVGPQVADEANWPTKNIPLGLDLVEGRPFIVYEAVACGVGLTDAEQRANRKLELHEQFWVEQQFATAVLNTADTVKLNGDTALPLVQAIGLMEQELAARYGGVGTLHARRNVAAAVDSMGMGEFRSDGDRLVSTLDNVWAFGAGYPHANPDGGAAPADGQAWIYGTGPVVVRRSEVQTRSDFSTTRNIRMALAERAYVITADCLRLAVLATLPGSP